ncbi:SDR family NAD(P)-dependent oxidoreductase [Marinilabilia rubra]|uniref:Short-chain dehydrogenase n=1 Tax=Marinilabilia rubra TaxID=2162893 RepID=A0A2U2BAQ3_9BACT|nr:SDR family NAD(P)-dependent oxidoreductase [Marinilabilia rubra]PWE00138.1 short-chain dehydrogenase [Marinilabilia rubra]
MEKTKNETYALITGASKGFGELLAFELAYRRINVILVALPHEDILSVAAKCRELGVKAETYEADLTNREDLLRMTDWANKNFNINILINNAGKGGTQTFHKSDLSYVDNLIQINVLATTIITHQLLPNLLKQEKSYILNVSSMASFSPIGYKTVYSSTKRYIQHFSRALCNELKDTSVFVSVVLPGPMKTNSEITGRIEKQGLLGKIGLITPERAARVSIRRMLKQKPYILVGRRNYINKFLLALVPAKIRMRLMTKAASREIQF